MVPIISNLCISYHREWLHLCSVWRFDDDTPVEPNRCDPFPTRIGDMVSVHCLGPILAGPYMYMPEDKCATRKSDASVKYDEMVVTSERRRRTHPGCGCSSSRF